MKGIMEEEFFKGTSTIGLSYHNPLGEIYTDTRTDCEATIAGTEVENLEIIEEPNSELSIEEKEELFDLVRYAVALNAFRNGE